MLTKFHLIFTTTHLTKTYSHVVPVGTPGKKDWKIQALPTPIDTTKLIRTIEFSGSSAVGTTNEQQQQQQEIINLISKHMQDDLRNRGNNLPWWEFLLVKNSAEIGGINAVVFRVEHCLADGMSLAKLFEGSNLVLAKPNTCVNDGKILEYKLNLDCFFFMCTFVSMMKIEN